MDKVSILTEEEKQIIDDASQRFAELILLFLEERNSFKEGIDTFHEKLQINVLNKK